VRQRGFGSGLALAALLGASVGPACSQGSGSGTVCGTLDIANCWTGPFNLQPDFFAAVTASGNDSLQIRVQNGGDSETFSDGIAILVDHIDVVSGQLKQTLTVSLPAGVTTPGVPLMANPNPSEVHATLYLQKSCRTQNVALYALDAVSLSPTGGCGAADVGEPPNSCPLLTRSSASTPASSGADASVLPDGGVAAAGTVVGSTIVFNKIFNGDPNANADGRLTDVPQFDFFFADPRDIAPGGVGPPPPCRAHLVGNFKFYFERGQPEQPFP
jgi:hypothetical protein